MWSLGFVTWFLLDFIAFIFHFQQFVFSFSRREWGTLSKRKTREKAADDKQYVTNLSGVVNAEVFGSRVTWFEPKGSSQIHVLFRHHEIELLSDLAIKI